MIIVLMAPLALRKLYLNLQWALDIFLLCSGFISIFNLNEGYLVVFAYLIVQGGVLPGGVLPCPIYM